jgi:hypothetical protein
MQIGNRRNFNVEIQNHTNALIFISHPMIQSYFSSEQKAGFVACAIGLVFCTLGSGFLLGALPPFYTGLAVPLVGIGIVQVFVGATIARRSDFQAYDLQKLLGNDPEAFVELEAPRMGKVMRSFVLYRWLEGAFIVVGIALILLNNELVFSKGLGAGMFAQGIIMLVFDFFAEKRAKKYVEFIDAVLKE